MAPRAFWKGYLAPHYLTPDDKVGEEAFAVMLAPERRGGSEAAVGGVTASSFRSWRATRPRRGGNPPKDRAAGGRAGSACWRR